MMKQEDVEHMATFVESELEIFSGGGYRKVNLVLFNSKILIFDISNKTLLVDVPLDSTLITEKSVLYLINYINHPPLQKRLKHFRGPPPQVLIGNAFQFSDHLPTFTGQVLQFYKDFGGSPVKFKFGHIISVHVFNAVHVEATLKHTINISKTFYDYELIVSEWIGFGLLISKGEKWRRRRKLLTPAFHYEILQDFLPIINQQATILVEILKSTCKGGEFDICPYLSLCALDIISETAMGNKLGAQTNPDLEYVAAVAEATELIVHRTMKPWIWYPIAYYLTKDGKRMKQLLSILNNFTKNIIREQETKRMETKQKEVNMSKKGKRRPFLDLLLDLKEAGELNEDDVRAEVDTFMFEGHDTTATSMMWACYCLGRHEQLQRKVRDEVLRVVGKSESILTEHIAQLKYMDSFIKETMRLYPPVPLVGRKVEQDYYIDDEHMIPANTIVNINFLALHRDPDQFEDPLNFDPDRFLPENVSTRHPFAFTPFSGGPRNCIGQKFAMMEEKVILSHIIRNFEIKALQTESEMDESFKVILKPMNGVILQLTPL